MPASVFEKARSQFLNLKQASLLKTSINTSIHLLYTVAFYIFSKMDGFRVIFILYPALSIVLYVRPRLLAPNTTGAEYLNIFYWPKEKKG